MRERAAFPPVAGTAGKLSKNLPGSKNCHMHGLSPEGKNKFAAYRFVSLGGKKTKQKSIEGKELFKICCESFSKKR